MFIHGGTVRQVPSAGPDPDDPWARVYAPTSRASARPARCLAAEDMTFPPTPRLCWRPGATASYRSRCRRCPFRWLWRCRQTARARPDLVTLLVLVSVPSGRRKASGELAAAGRLTGQRGARRFSAATARPGPSMVRNAGDAVHAGYVAKTADLHGDIRALVNSGRPITIIAASDDGWFRPVRSVQWSYLPGGSRWPRLAARRPAEFARVVKPFVASAPGGKHIARSRTRLDSSQDDDQDRGYHRLTEARMPLPPYLGGSVAASSPPIPGDPIDPPQTDPPAKIKELTRSPGHSVPV